MPAPIFRRRAAAGAWSAGGGPRSPVGTRAHGAKPHRSCGDRSSQLAGWLLGLGWLAASGQASAYSVEAEVTSLAQGYSLYTADALSTTVARRRVTNYLGLRIDDIALGPRPRLDEPLQRNELAAAIELRVDADFGDYLCSIGRVTQSSALSCLDRSQGGVRTDPELANYRPELLFAYVEGRRLGGWLTLRLGRQLTWDLLDLRGLDGAQVSLQTPLHLRIDAWGGLSQNGALSIDPSLYVLDGTSRSPRRSPDDPMQQSRALQPTFGLSASLTGLRDLQARLSYRRTWSPTADLALPGCPAGSGCAPTWGRIEDRIAGSVHGRALDGRLQAWTALRYDLLSGRVDDAQASLRAAVAGSQVAGDGETMRAAHALQADYRYSVPTWDGDSIWNVFGADPYHHGQLRYDGRRGLRSLGRRARHSSELAWSARGWGRVFVDLARPAAGASDPTGAEQTLQAAGGGDLSLLYRRASSHLRLDGFIDAGYGGTRGGGDVAGRWALLYDVISLEGRVLYTYWADGLRDTNRSHGVALQAGVRWAFMRGALIHVLIEDSIDRFYSSQVRLLATLDLSYALGPHGGARSPAGFLPAGFGDAPRALPLPGLLP